jgi:hypothetical protein
MWPLALHITLQALHLNSFGPRILGHILIPAAVPLSQARTSISTVLIDRLYSMISKRGVVNDVSALCCLRSPKCSPELKITRNPVTYSQLGTERVGFEPTVRLPIQRFSRPLRLRRKSEVGSILGGRDLNLLTPHPRDCYADDRRR